ncbi:MAG: tetratricopeptide repeat protein, partial [bacterium]|nr:tetratricopeptide repeat protein [bacterium]
PPLPKGPEALSPKREASQNMIRVGEHYLEQGNVDKATQTFQEAINIDPENGVAYYYLSKGLSQKQAYDDALGVLEKSETLLGRYPEWVAEVKRLRAQIEETKANPSSLPQTGYPGLIYH